ncbi:MAG: signal peptide peptidase SppA [Candidatus Micrarchaeia archaeon]
MEPEIRRRPARPNNGLIVGTGLALVFLFILLIAIFFALSALGPSFVGKCVAVVSIDTPLSVEGSPGSVLGGGGTPGSEELASTISDLGKRDDVGAVLFIFNSPGGSVVATREIYEAVHGLSKPKVSYFREVAASGAYYVASGTDYIVSDPDAITGSIGVIATFTDMQGLLEKVGVNITPIKSGPHKDIGSSFRNMTPEETAILQGMIDEVYGEFKSVVLQNRGSRLDKSKFNEITDGRILSGRQAAKVGLVDKVGNKKDAILKAAELAGIKAESAEDVRLCPVSTSVSEPGLFNLEGVFRSLTAKAGVPTLSFK